MHDGMNKLWKLLLISKAVDPQKHTKVTKMLSETASGFASGSIADACVAANEALDEAKDLDIKVAWYSFGRIIREDLLSRPNVSAQFVATNGSDYTDQAARSASGGLNDSAVFTRGMLAKIGQKNDEFVTT